MKERSTLGKDSFHHSRYLTAVAVTAAAVALLAGGASASLATPAVAVGRPSAGTNMSSFCAPGQSVTLTAWSHDPNYKAEFTQELGAWAKLEGLKCKISISTTILPGSSIYTKELSSMAAHSSLPNIIDYSTQIFAGPLYSGIMQATLVPMNSYMTAAALKDTLETAPYTVNGTIYGLPDGFSPTVYYYQPGIFAKYGLPQPSNSWTWAQFAKVGAALAKHGVAMSPACQDLGCYEFYALFGEDGGQLYNNDGQFVLNKAPNAGIFEQTVNFIDQQVQDGAFQVETSSEFYAPPMFKQYESGTVAGVLAPAWYAPYELQDVAGMMKGKWSVVELPAAPSSSYRSDLVGNTGFAVVKATANYQLAASFLAYSCATPQGQIKDYQISGYVPNYVPVLQSPAFTASKDPYFLGPTPASVYGAAALKLEPYYVGQNEAQVLQVLGTSLTSNYAGKLTPAAIITKLAAVASVGA